MPRILGKHYNVVEDFYNPNPFVHPKDLPPTALYYLEGGISRRGGQGESYDKYHVGVMIPDGAWKVKVIEKLTYISDDGVKWVNIQKLFHSVQVAEQYLPQDKYW